MSAGWKCLADSLSRRCMAALALPLVGSTEMQSALDPAGPQAARIHDLWWLMFAVCSAVFLAVVGVLLYAIFRLRPDEADVAGPEAERRMTTVVTGATVVTVVILFALLVVSVFAGRGFSTPSAPDPVMLEVIDHQWWWEVHYVDAVPSQRIVTANEVHIPVGRPVVLQLTSQDVIHSFWAPNLHGKRDLIPGHTTTISFQADKPGVFRGQCAEFCGYQHAHMAFLLVAEPSDQFAAWLAVPMMEGMGVYLVPLMVGARNIAFPRGGK